MPQCPSVFNKIDNRTQRIVPTHTRPQVEGDAHCRTTSHGWMDIYVLCELQHCWYMLLHKIFAGGESNNWNSMRNQRPQP